MYGEKNKVNVTSKMEGYTQIKGYVKRTVRRGGLWSYLVEENGQESWYPHGSVIDTGTEVYIKTDIYNKKHKLDV